MTVPQSVCCQPWSYLVLPNLSMVSVLIFLLSIYSTGLGLGTSPGDFEKLGHEGPRFQSSSSHCVHVRCQLLPLPCCYLCPFTPLWSWGLILIYKGVVFSWPFSIRWGCSVPSGEDIMLISFLGGLGLNQGQLNARYLSSYLSYLLFFFFFSYLLFKPLRPHFGTLRPRFPSQLSNESSS